VFQDLDRNSTRNTAFSLLAAVLRRKLVVPEVYDLLERVRAVMLHTHTASVRATCVSLLQRFLLHYPISSKGLEAHLSFLVANLGYEYEGARGRAAGVHGALLRGPTSPCSSRGREALFVALVMRLQVEPEGRLRLLVGTTVKALLARLHEHAAQERRGGQERAPPGPPALLLRGLAQRLGVTAGCSEQGLR